MRGNVGTRLEIVATGIVEAAILAFAGLKRLGLCQAKLFSEQYPTLKMRPLPLDHFTPTAGQGVLVVECAPERASFFRPINHDHTATICQLERRFAAAFGGSCQTAVACHIAKDNDDYRMYTFLEGQYGQYPLPSLTETEEDPAIVDAIIADFQTKRQSCA